jgi:hypothetical protein
MTFREKLIDIISGGELSRAFRLSEEWHKLYLQAKADYVASASQSSKGWEVAAAAHNKLREIVAMETPNMAHIGKRMVAVAKEGLGE